MEAGNGWGGATHGRLRVVKVIVIVVVALLVVLAVAACPHRRLAAATRRQLLLVLHLLVLLVVFLVLFALFRAILIALGPGLHRRAHRLALVRLEEAARVVGEELGRADDKRQRQIDVRVAGQGRRGGLVFELLVIERKGAHRVQAQLHQGRALAHERRLLLLLSLRGRLHDAGSRRFVGGRVVGGLLVDAMLHELRARQRAELVGRIRQLHMCARHIQPEVVERGCELGRAPLKVGAESFERLE